MATRRFRFLMFHSLLLLLPVLFYLGGRRISWQWDLTEEGYHTLSETSRQLVADLKQPLTIELFMAADLPAALQPAHQRLLALLEQYRLAGGNQVQFTVKHPHGDPELENELAQSGLKPIRINQVRDDQLTMSELWYALRLKSQDYEEIISDLSRLEDPEYQITTAIIRLTHQRQIRLALVGPPLSFGNGGYTFTQNGNLKRAVDSLSAAYEVGLVPVVPSQPLDLKEFDAAFVWGLHYFEPSQLYQLEQAILAGFPTTFLVAGVEIDPVFAVAAPRPVTDVDSWFEHLGFRLGRSLVADQKAAKVKYTQTKPPVLKKYPLFPELSAGEGGLGLNEPAHGQIDSLVLPWCSPIHATNPAGVVSKVIGQTSPEAWLQEAPFELNPAKVPGPTSFAQYTVGLHLRGRYDAYFQSESAAANHRSRGTDVTLRVWSSDFLATSIRKASTLVWLNQTADAMTRNSLTTGIERRVNAQRPLRALSTEERDNTRRLSLLLAPLLPALIGLLYRVQRRRRSVECYRQGACPDDPS